MAKDCELESPVTGSFHAGATVNPAGSKRNVDLLIRVINGYSCTASVAMSWARKDWTIVVLPSPSQASFGSFKA